MPHRHLDRVDAMPKSTILIYRCGKDGVVVSTCENAVVLISVTTRVRVINKVPSHRTLPSGFPQASEL